MRPPRVVAPLTTPLTTRATTRDGGLVGVVRAHLRRKSEATERACRRRAIVTRAAASGDGTGGGQIRRLDANPARPNGDDPRSRPSVGAFSSDDAKDALAAVAVTYAFAAWRWLPWPAAAPTAALVPAPHVAAAVALGATARRRFRSWRSPRTPASTTAFDGRSFFAPRSAFEARARSSARSLVLSALAAAHFIAGAEALHVLLATLTPAASVVGAGSWSSAACYAAAWIMQSRACGGFARAAIVKGGASFVVVTALLAAKHNMFHGGVVKGAAAAAASAATRPGAHRGSATTGAHPALDIALALVGVWALMSGVALDTAAAGTVEEAFDATKFGRALAPAKERAVKFARRLPIAAAFAAAFASIAMNPNAVAALASIGVEPRAILPLFIALAAPAATAVARAAAPAFSDANVAMFAAFAMFVNAGLAARDRPAVAAGALGGLFAAATAVVAPAMSVALTDYFVVRKRNLDTHALVDGDDSRGDFWFTGGFNPRAVAAAVAGAAVPLWDFAATAAIGARMVGVTGAGVECIVAPGVALARGAGAGALVSSALYLLFNKLAPAPRVASGGGAYARGGTTAARVIAADGTATYVDDIVDAERGAATDAEIVGGAMGSGAEAKGQTWSRPGGGGGPRGDGPEEDDDGVADVDVEKARSRLERFFEMESEEPPPFTDQPEEDADLGVGLGVSLRAELQSQLERRRAKTRRFTRAEERGEERTRRHRRARRGGRRGVTTRDQGVRGWRFRATPRTRRADSCRETRPRFVALGTLTARVPRLADTSTSPANGARFPRRRRRA